MLSSRRSLLAEKKGKVPVGVQLYCVRHELPKDMAGTLGSLAKMGFEGVEFADYHGHSAKDLRKLLDDAGLKCCGTHIYLEDMLGEKLGPTLEFNKTIGNPYLIVRWLGEERRNTPEAFKETVGLFNEVSEKLEPHGMRVGYHNHDYIFEKIGGELKWNILADKCRKDVILQLDTGNASNAGLDVIELLKRNEGRTVTLHVKPFSKKNPKAYMGEDDLDWNTILDLAEGVGGVEWHIVEYEVPGIPPLEALGANLKILRNKYGR
jgi:sugar phosphate isomerase/epimerase